MPIPVVPLVLGGGLAALLFAGKAEAKAAPKPSSAPAAGTATPTQATTGGAAGGAQYPSHSGPDAAKGELGAASATQTGAGTVTSTAGTTTAGHAYTSKDLAADVSGAAGGAIQTGQESAFTQTAATAAEKVEINPNQWQIDYANWLDSLANTFGPTKDTTSRLQSIAYSEKSGSIY